ncbi:anaerobic dimethylsulfoxide reductase, A subunit [Treponema primitia ZAS-2]|uniref:Anaerobic dimethylsulfoxide reductase, A subunit n=1 Tax=Treponema primitia (strain ATCC BAA-887 / DSM 12427 / ZAS-2) TaxID=545694 RepID=F5YLG5_TREPZ|nr:anaerobic dimethylsulfoxide reductase, A subunit [Treponema primitia ZAS-2]
MSVYLYHWFALFFDSFPEWLKTVKPQGILGDLVRHIEGTDEAALRLEYDALFKGTNAHIRIPLWASAIQGQTLMDKTTAGLIARYRQNGYTSVAMDGNPPDYIGQQLRFMEYLSACAITDPEATGAEAEQIRSVYLAGTVRAVREGVETYARHALFPAVLQALDTFVTSPQVFEDIEIQGLEEQLSRLWCYGNIQTGKNVSLPPEPSRIILTAGINNCGGKCVIRAETQYGCILRIMGSFDPQDPQLRPCVRIRGYQGTFLHRERLRYPLRRVGKRGEGKFRRISWQEAVEEISREWVRIRDTYGAASRYVNYSVGVASVMRPDKLAMRLLNADGGFLSYYNSYSSACTRWITPYIYGDNLSGNSLDDVLNAKLIILWGHNPVETIFGNHRNYYLAQAKAQGIKIIVIDPRFSDSAAHYADQWIGIRPSTDSALADGMAFEIWSLGLQDQAFMDQRCLGFDEAHMPDDVPKNECYRAYLFGEKDGIPKTPEWAESITAVPADTIRTLAQEYVAAKPACLLPGFGIQRTGNGEQTVRSLALLACLTGNVGISGGGAAGTGDIAKHQNPALPLLDFPYQGKIPCFLWTQAVERGPSMGAEDGVLGVDRLHTNIKMILNLAGNTLVNQHSDINATKKILEDETKCEFILCSDLFMTSSAMFADILLPGASVFETDNITAPWGGFGDYLLRNNQVIDPLFEGRFEYEWLREVAEKIGCREAFDGGYRSMGEWLQGLYEDTRKTEPELPNFETFKKTGIYRYKNNPVYIAYAKQRADPATALFETPSGRIEIFSPRLYGLHKKDVPGIPAYVPCPEGPGDPLREQYPLQLIGWHTKRRTHTIHDNNEGMEGMEPQRLWIHPQDADVRGLSEGDLADIFNARGKICIPVHVTDRIMAGVIALSQGAWYQPDSEGVDRRGSINVLTSADHPTPLAKGNPQHTNLVEVVKSQA